MSDGRWEAEERRQLDEKYLHMCQVAEDSARELMERDKMLAGAFRHEKELKAKIHRLEDYIDNIAAIIAYQCSLKDQDLWMADMIKEGLYKPDEETLDILKEDGRYRYGED